MKINYLYVFAATLLIIAGFGLSFRQKHTYNKIPKKIWTYLESSDRIPKTTTLCIESWKKYHPEYEIIVLTRNTFKGYVTIPPEILNNPIFNDKTNHFSELVCLWTLAEHGGAWIEPTILVTQTMNDWLFDKYAEFSGFYSELSTKNKEYPVIQNWFLACNKGSKFIKSWRDEYSKIVKYPNIEKYVESIKKQGVDFKGIQDPIYSAQAVALQKMIQIDKYPLESILLKKSEDLPLKYLVDSKGDSEKGLKLACANKKYRQPIIRFRENEVKVLEEQLDYDLSEQICSWLE